MRLLGVVQRMLEGPRCAPYTAHRNLTRGGEVLGCSLVSLNFHIEEIKPTFPQSPSAVRAALEKATFEMGDKEVFMLMRYPVSIGPLNECDLDEMFRVIRRVRSARPTRFVLLNEILYMANKTLRLVHFTLHRFI